MDDFERQPAHAALQLAPVSDDAASSACFGKAKLTAEVARKLTGLRRGKGRVAYRCAHCRCWHLGHDPLRRKH